MEDQSASIPERGVWNRKTRPRVACPAFPAHLVLLARLPISQTALAESPHNASIYGVRSLIFYKESGISGRLKYAHRGGGSV